MIEVSCDACGKALHHQTEAWHVTINPPHVVTEPDFRSYQYCPECVSIIRDLCEAMLQKVVGFTHERGPDTS